MTDVSLDDKYLLMSQPFGTDLGIYALDLADKSCTALVPDLTAWEPRFSSDGKSIIYVISAKGTTTVNRVAWRDGKAFGKPEIVIKLPFAFSQGQSFNGNAYDVATRSLQDRILARWRTI